ncbi:hypothetical protein M0R45_007465 [Rubus argutus]|uniref:Uncharacterized protein n=1 Tax=Rubus argutus TaxID=59490 RepID=A0AAW1XZW7_RUBAR
MEKEQRTYKAHCLVLPYPTQGHINPLFQFSKLLDHKQVKVTLVTTRFAYKTMHRESSSIELETISDGYDEGGIYQAESIQAYIDRFWQVGPQTLAELFEKLSSSGCPVDCVVYDSVIPWALDVAKKYGIVGAAFFTTSCVVDNIYYHVNKGLLKLPLTESEISLPGLPPLLHLDFPSFIYDFGSYPAYYDVVIGQFSNVDKADWILCNTFYELEKQVVDWMTDFLPVRTIGPSIPSDYLNRRLEGDKDYGINLFKSNNDTCMKWLNEQRKGSVVYVSFGSGAELDVEQMEELAWGLRRGKSKFLWVVRESEAAKVPKGFIEETTEKGLVVSWCSQLEADEKGIVRQGEVEHCVSEIMEGARGKEIQRNAMKWKELAKKAVDEGGSSDRNIDEFIAKLVQH